MPERYSDEVRKRLLNLAEAIGRREAEKMSEKLLAHAVEVDAPASVRARDRERAGSRADEG